MPFSCSQQEHARITNPRHLFKHQVNMDQQPSSPYTVSLILPNWTLQVLQFHQCERCAGIFRLSGVLPPIWALLCKSGRSLVLSYSAAIRAMVANGKTKALL